MSERAEAEKRCQSRMFYVSFVHFLFYCLVALRIAQLLGYSADEMLGQSAYQFHHMLDHDAVTKSYKTSALASSFVVLFCCFFSFSIDDYGFHLCPSCLFVCFFWLRNNDKPRRLRQ